MNIFTYYLFAYNDQHIMLGKWKDSCTHNLRRMDGCDMYTAFPAENATHASMEALDEVHLFCNCI